MDFNFKLHQVFLCGNRKRGELIPLSFKQIRYEYDIRKKTRTMFIGFIKYEILCGNGLSLIGEICEENAEIDYKDCSSYSPPLLSLSLFP